MSLSLNTISDHYITQKTIHLHQYIQYVQTHIPLESSLQDESNGMRINAIQQSYGPLKNHQVLKHGHAILFFPNFHNTITAYVPRIISIHSILGLYTQGTNLPHTLPIKNLEPHMAPQDHMTTIGTEQIHLSVAKKKFL